MPIQRLSLFAPLPSRHLESLVTAVQTLTSEPLDQFKTLTRVFKDDSSMEGRRPSNFIRIRHIVPIHDSNDGDIVDTSFTSKDEKASINDAATHPQQGASETRSVTPTRTYTMEVVDAPEINHRKQVTSRIVHVVPCTAGGDPGSLAALMGYAASFAYFEQGYVLAIGFIVLRIYQIFRAQKKGLSFDDNNASEMGNVMDGGNGGAMQQKSGRGGGAGMADVDTFDGLIIGDGATWIVQADVETRTNAPEELRKGTEELLRLKKELRGIVDLGPLLDELR